MGKSQSTPDFNDQSDAQVSFNSLDDTTSDYMRDTRVEEHHRPGQQLLSSLDHVWHHSGK